MIICHTSYPYVIIWSVLPPSLKNWPMVFVKDHIFLTWLKIDTESLTLTHESVYISNVHANIIDNRQRVLSCWLPFLITLRWFLILMQFLYFQIMFDLNFSETFQIHVNIQRVIGHGWRMMTLISLMFDKFEWTDINIHNDGSHFLGYHGT